MFADSDPDEALVAMAVEMFTMLADPTRVRIIMALSDGEMSVGDLADSVDKSPSAVSQHLAKLRLAHMVAPRPDGTRVRYRLVDEHARRLVTDALHQAEHAVTEAPGHHAPGRGEQAEQ